MSVFADSADPASPYLSLLVFVIARILPGDPVQLAAGPQATKSEIEAKLSQDGADRKSRGRPR